jgi:CheY-like chemotaxis protein
MPKPAPILPNATPGADMKPRLLIVEDDVALAELLVWQFENAGYEVEQTPDGDEALLDD